MNMNPSSQNPMHDVRNFFRQRSVLSFLVIINISVWLLIQILRVLAFLFDHAESTSFFPSLVDYLAVPASLPLVLERPWTIFTYMILHVSIWHILFNMLWLYWFGKIFLEYLTEKQLLWTYILGGLAGAFIYILAFNIFPVFKPTLDVSYALGASASVMAIVTAIAFYVPNYTIYLLFFGRVKIIYLAIALFIFDFFMIPTGNAGGHIAHIGGALFGFIFIKMIRPSHLTVKKENSSWSRWFPRIFSSSTNRKSRSSLRYGRSVTDEDFNFRKAQQQKRIDLILEKISKGGYDSLTKEEKDYLFKSSGKL